MPPPNYDALLVQLQYPGTTLVETEVIRAWILARGFPYDEILFNVRLGPGTPASGEVDETTRRDWQLLTQKRADVVARIGSEYTILEAKDRASTDALGKLLMYRDLWLAEHPETTELFLRVICRRTDDIVARAIAAAGIGLEVYPVEAPP